MQNVHPKSTDAPDEKTMEVNSSRVKGARAPVKEPRALPCMFYKPYFRDWTSKCTTTLTKRWRRGRREARGAGADGGAPARAVGAEDAAGVPWLADGGGGGDR